MTATARRPLLIEGTAPVIIDEAHETRYWYIGRGIPDHEVESSLDGEVDEPSTIGIINCFEVDPRTRQVLATSLAN
jgi:hypothetical protein